MGSSLKTIPPPPWPRRFGKGWLCISNRLCSITSGKTRCPQIFRGRARPNNMSTFIEGLVPDAAGALKRERLKREGRAGENSNIQAPTSREDPNSKFQLEHSNGQ